MTLHSSSLLKFLNFIIVTSGTGVFLATISFDSWFLNLFTHFYLYYFIAFSVAALISLFLKKYFHFLFSFFAIGICGYHIQQFPPVYSKAKIHKLKIYYQNINSSNRSLDLLTDKINALDPELVALVETTPDAETMFDKKLKKFPYRVSLPQEDNFGFSLYSKYNIKLLEVRRKEDFQVYVKFYIKEIDSKFYLIHLPPPLWQGAWSIQKQTLKEISDSWPRSEKSHLVLMGDFNMASWSNIYQDFFAEIFPNYYSSHQHFSGSWPSFFPTIFRLPIDHIFSNRPFSLEAIPATGSDHVGFLIGLD